MDSCDSFYLHGITTQKAINDSILLYILMDDIQVKSVLAALLQIYFYSFFGDFYIRKRHAMFPLPSNRSSSCSDLQVNDIDILPMCGTRTSGFITLLQRSARHWTRSSSKHTGAWTQAKLEKRKPPPYRLQDPRKALNSFLCCEKLALLLNVSSDKPRQSHTKSDFEERCWSMKRLWMEDDPVYHSAQLHPPSKEDHTTWMTFSSSYRLASISAG